VDERVQDGWDYEWGWAEVGGQAAEG
jgi:hypothetical protein